MSLPYLPNYYINSVAATEQLRSCLTAMQTPTSSSSTSSPFSIDSLLSSRVPLPLSSLSFPSTLSFPLPSELFHPAAWPSTAGYPFLHPSFLGSPMLPPSFLPSFFGGKRKRRHRTIFSEEQLQILETTFTTTHYPDVALREKLAIQCDLKEERVEVWFKNRRAKERKQKREGSKEGAKMAASDESEYEVSDEDESKPKRSKSEQSDEKEKSTPEKREQTADGERKSVKREESAEKKTTNKES